MRPLAPAIAATHGYTTAFTDAAAILGMGVIVAVVVLPSRRALRLLAGDKVLAGLPGHDNSERISPCQK